MVKKDTIEDNVTDADLKKTMNQSDRWQVVENIDQRLIIWVWLPMQLRRLTDIWKLILSMTCPVIGWTFKEADNLGMFCNSAERFVIVLLYFC